MGQKILLADDSNVAQRMGKEILSGEGFEVIAVSNGQAALKKLKEYTPDLILADIFMPGASGYELCQFVKSEPLLAQIPVLLLVGAMEPYDPEEGRRVRADGVITKPLQSSNLLSLVKQVLETPPRIERPKSPSTRGTAKVISVPATKPAAVAPAPFAGPAAFTAPARTSPSKAVPIPVTEAAPAESAPFAESAAAVWAPEPAPPSYGEAAFPETEADAADYAPFPETAEAEGTGYASFPEPAEAETALAAAPEPLFEPEPSPPMEMSAETQALLDDLLGTASQEAELPPTGQQEMAEHTHALLDDLLGTVSREPEPMAHMPSQPAEEPQATVEEFQETSAPEVAWTEPEPHFRVDFADASGSDAQAIADTEPEAASAEFPFYAPTESEETPGAASAPRASGMEPGLEESAGEDQGVAFAEPPSGTLAEGEEASSSFESMSRAAEEPVVNEADEEVLSLLGEVTLAELEATGLQELMNAEPAAELPAEAPEAPMSLVWTAEPAEVTEQDRQVFGETAADWEALGQLAEDSPQLVESAPTASAGKQEPIPVPAAASAESAVPGIPVTEAEPGALVAEVQEPEIPVIPSHEAPPPVAPEYTNPALDAQSPEPALVSTPVAEQEPESPAAQFQELETVATQFQEPEAPAIAVQEMETPPPPAAPETPNPAISQFGALEPLVVDPAMLERLVRESVERMMPQIVDRIARSVGIILRPEQ